MLKYERKSRYKSNFQFVSFRRRVCLCPVMSRDMFLQSQFVFLPSKTCLFPQKSSLEFVLHCGKPNLIVCRLLKFPADRSKFQLCTTVRSNKSGKHETQCFITSWNAEKRVENTTRSRVFLTKHCVECLILFLKENDYKTEKLRTQKWPVFHLIFKHSLNINFFCIFFMNYWWVLEVSLH